MTPACPALEEAVSVQRQAVAIAAPENIDRAGYLSNLSSFLHELGEHAADRGLLAEAVQVARDGVAVSANGPNEAACLYSLGNALLAFGSATGHRASVAEASQCMAKVAASLNAPPYLRLNAYQVMARIPDRDGSSPVDRLAAMEAAASLLPQFALRTLNRSDREYNIGRLSSIAAQAAAVACEAGQPGRAVELLEQTRGILVADTLDARSSDLTRLRARQPDLAGEFERLRDLLEALGQGDGTIFQSEDDASFRPDGNADAWWARIQERREAEAAWGRIIERIRATDEFTDFLARPDVRKLAVHASDGPIVFVYAGERRSDALILRNDANIPVRPVPLPALTEEAAGEQVERLLRAQAATGNGELPPEERIAAQGEILEILTWTWDTITGPVLEALGLAAGSADGESWPHIWWCPVGFLSFLPLHASALDRVVSSYITTLRGLVYSRSQRPGTGGTVIVAVPDAPDVQPLVAVEAEAESLARLIPGARVLTRPTRAEVLAALPDSRVVHLACHGYVNWDDPASSQLILYDHRTSPLTVADISRLQLLSGLAYLSACDTAVTSFSLANEAVHITGAFHLSGYQHVIGTLWQVNDPTARDVAVDFYNSLTSDGSTPPVTERAAGALQQATRRLRDRYPRTPTLWAAYIHTGS
jgi:hypothetical protein